MLTGHRCRPVTQPGSEQNAKEKDLVPAFRQSVVWLEQKNLEVLRLQGSLKFCAAGSGQEAGGNQDSREDGEGSFLERAGLELHLEE